MLTHMYTHKHTHTHTYTHTHTRTHTQHTHSRLSKFWGGGGKLGKFRLRWNEERGWVGSNDAGGHTDFPLGGANKTSHSICLICLEVTGGWWGNWERPICEAITSKTDGISHKATTYLLIGNPWRFYYLGFGNWLMVKVKGNFYKWRHVLRERRMWTMF